MLEMPKDISLAPSAPKKLKGHFSVHPWEPVERTALHTARVLLILPDLSAVVAVGYLQVPAALQSTSSIARPQLPREGAGLGYGGCHSLC